MSLYPQARATAITAGAQRVLVDGADRTWFRATTPRDQPMEVPEYELIEPLAYGMSGPLVIPRTNCIYEQIGTGELAWAKTGAEVRYQTQQPGGSWATDYVGVVNDIATEGTQWALIIGGQITGRASTMYRPAPVVRKTWDIGHWLYLAALELNIPVTPNAGPTTGFDLVDDGDMSLLAWIQKLCTMAQNRFGDQKTFMPTLWGRGPWEVRSKNTTTRHVTIFTDGATARLQVSRMTADDPNTYWGSGVKPNGTRWKNAEYPGFIQGPPPRYPVTSNNEPGGPPVNFGLGTTDADTWSGSGIEALKNRLVAMGFLDSPYPYTGVYDQGIYNAVWDLKKKAGLSNNGTMTSDAWSALWDIDVTGYSAVGAGIRPLLQDSKVRKWHETSNGSLARRNPTYDPKALRVDRQIDGGPGTTPRQLRDFVTGQRARAGEESWSGTLTLDDGFGGWYGEWDSSDAAFLQSADGVEHICPQHAIRAGWNFWEPNFQGGTLFHISSARRSANGRGLVLTIDTQARDHLELQAIISRNVEARRDVRREKHAANRANANSSSMVSRDEHFGILFQDVPLDGNRWNLVPFVMGQSGTVNKTVLNLFDAKTEFCAAVFGQRMTEAQLMKQIGNPFPVNEDGEAVWQQQANSDWLDEKELLWAAGSELNPCGYGKRSKFRPDGETRTKAPLTGRHVDETPWPYVTISARLPIVWLAIWPRKRCTLRNGQIFYALEDDVT